MEKKLTRDEFMKKVINDYYKKRYLRNKKKSEAITTNIEGIERTTRRKWRLGQH
ncbi:hypothetical protein [Clostridium botulinum]|uniref:hypothetical protein n=1 Tax=Clostridium botulinum TaxID=1491 RepID=UPI000AAD0B6E|nr:hypothetical protein [Clostridium botulinum]